MPPEMPMRIVDSHCHLDYLAGDGDLPETLRRARMAGVETMLTISTKLSTFPQVLAIAEAEPDVVCSVGVHPHEAGPEGQETAERLIELAAHEKVVGIGETGLDYYYDHSPRDRQQISFRAHIAAARETGLPLIVHTRDADDDTVAILRDEHEKGPYPGVLHCFTAGPALAKAALEMGLSISLAGIITFKKAEELRATAADIPLDRLLVETDSPYLAPVPFRGKRNEPAHVVHTARRLAEIKGVSEEELTETTTANFYRLFSKAASSRSAA